jgi:hypothetical protein
MTRKIIEDQGQFYAVEYDPHYPAEVTIIGTFADREKAQEVLDKRS